RKRPRVPLAQMTLGPAALSPRSSASVPDGTAVHCAIADAGNTRRIVMSKLSRMERLRPELARHSEDPQGKIEAHERPDEQGVTMKYLTPPSTSPHARTK